MQLSIMEVEVFFETHASVMSYYSRRFGVDSDLDTPEGFLAAPPERQIKVRDVFIEHPDVLEEYAEVNPEDYPPEALEVVRTWKHFRFGKFFLLKYAAKHAVFLEQGENGADPRAFAVKALWMPFDVLMTQKPPIFVQTLLLPFGPQIVYDGIMIAYNVSLGPGIRAGLNDSFKEAKANYGLITTLPPPATRADLPQPAPVPRPQTRKRRSDAKPKSRPKPKQKSTPAEFEPIYRLVEEFCAEHLNEEYAELCRKLTDKLARKRPSPLLRGKPTTWACGIVRAIGWLNFLDDRSQTPHLKAAEIDKAFGVGTSTAQMKSKEIRDLLKLRMWDHHWTLPSRWGENPLIWTLEFNGLPFDVRDAPREVQEEAFRKGLIPYIPADAE